MPNFCCFVPHKSQRIIQPRPLKLTSSPHILYRVQWLLGEHIEKDVQDSDCNALTSNSTVICCRYSTYS
ncbi:uncharacterized protein CYBJADRAFT_92058 [Cyberlindnera jadinii NRRL Y-1542]|uniref:Uncharacterized protein n=1 Tax=Cyberlindnera jadinii (strain ATCC 18201 / CBS 1600 / BCRC 20928 / JCM 3617 / NBRC 0987 / NRRL Y-1542) TaxID=983966 RepID=A0A1E4S1I3_CYBJN|nr:hypothetical protein CYBJADRAFT_92058 [Cyberlindnera jadinii NRRL Y-1542]ODV73338.1 hypothetical protein CYBJADRAFT_92058 [Cyberlindnera jadinii NRRL Y-1542]